MALFCGLNKSSTSKGRALKSSKGSLLDTITSFPPKNDVEPVLDNLNLLER